MFDTGAIKIGGLIEQLIIKGRGPMIFYAQKAIFSQFFLRSGLILRMTLIEIWPKTR